MVIINTVQSHMKVCTACAYTIVWVCMCTHYCVGMHVHTAACTACPSNMPSMLYVRPSIFLLKLLFAWHTNMYWRISVYYSILSCSTIYNGILSCSTIYCSMLLCTTIYYYIIYHNIP